MTSKETNKKLEEFEKSISLNENESKKIDEELENLKIEISNEEQNIRNKIKEFTSKNKRFQQNETGKSFGFIVFVLLWLTSVFYLWKFGYLFPFWWKGLVYFLLSLIVVFVVWVAILNKILKLFFRKNVMNHENYDSELKKVSNKEDLNKLNQKLTSRLSNLSNLNKKNDSLKKQLANLNSINELVTTYDKDDNGLLDIAETTNIDKLLSKHQKEIREIEKADKTSFIPDLVKVNNYLNDYQNNLKEEFKLLVSDYSVKTHVKANTKKFVEDFEMYKILISSLVLMIDSIIKDNHILYFKLKESMDKYGIYDTNFQKNQVALMKENNRATYDLIKETKLSKEAIIKSLKSVEDGVNDNLWNIKVEIEKTSKKMQENFEIIDDTLTYGFDELHNKK